MARRRVTYAQVLGPPPRAADRIEVELGPPPVHAPPRPPPTGRRPAAAGLALAALVAWTAWPSADGLRPRPQLAVVERVADWSPVLVDPATVVGAPWHGVVEHRPDARRSAAVPFVHVLAVARRDGGAAGFFVLDGARRGPTDEWAVGRSSPVRWLGVERGRGLRTREWDRGGYGIALTAVGLTVGEQDQLAGALVLPAGHPVDGRAPRLLVAVLGRLGLGVTDVRSAPVGSGGSPLIGQGGGASVGGLVEDGAGRSVRVSVVEDQLATAARLRRALEPHADAARSVPGAMAVAALAHPGPAPTGGVLRGWARVLVDHPAGVTVALSSDDVGVDELVAMARAMDLQRLRRALVPLP